MKTKEAEKLSAVFEDIKDPRSLQGIRHQLNEIITISILAFICDANDYVDIREYGLANEPWLKTFLKLKHGIPSRDTFERVFSILEPNVWQERYREWAKELVPTEFDESQDDIIAIDGKTSKGSHQLNENLKALHTVSAWSSYSGIVLAQEKVDEKTNEITVIPELLASINPAGAIVTIDAMGTQKDIAWEIREHKADYLLALKDNHPKLYSDVRWLFEQADETKWQNLDYSYTKTEEQSHGRFEQRECWVMDDLSFLEQQSAWCDLTSIVRVRATRTNNGSTTINDRFYISSLEADAARILHASRTHWGIENSVHWILDVVFKDDSSRARKQNAQSNLVTLRHIALNVLKLDTSTKLSIKAKRKRAGWNKDYLLHLLSLL